MPQFRASSPANFVKHDQTICLGSGFVMKIHEGKAGGADAGKTSAVTDKATASDKTGYIAGPSFIMVA